MTFSSYTDDDPIYSASLGAPFVIEDGFTVSTVVDMFHTLPVEVASGVVTLRPDMVTGLPFKVLATPYEGGFSAHYAEADSVLRVMYAAPHLASVLEVGGPAICITAPGGVSGQAWATTLGEGQVAGGVYVGEDASGKLGWAIFAEGASPATAAHVEMQIAAAIGSTTTLECEATSDVPPPMSDDTYASGVPEIADPTAQVTMALLAR